MFFGFIAFLGQSVSPTCGMCMIRDMCVLLNTNKDIQVMKCIFVLIPAYSIRLIFTVTEIT